jgi:hypothetical protein
MNIDKDTKIDSSRILIEWIVLLDYRLKVYSQYNNNKKGFSQHLSGGYFPSIIATQTVVKDYT